MKHLKNWRRNAVVATVLLFVCAGIYLNWSYTQNAAVSDLTDTLDATQVMGENTLVMGEQNGKSQEVSGGQEMTNYFASVRLSRQESRDMAVSALQETMAYEDMEEIYLRQEFGRHYSNRIGRGRNRIACYCKRL